MPQTITNEGADVLNPTIISAEKGNFDTVTVNNSIIQNYSQRLVASITTEPSESKRLFNILTPAGFSMVRINIYGSDMGYSGVSPIPRSRTIVFEVFKQYDESAPVENHTEEYNGLNTSSDFQLYLSGSTDPSEAENGYMLYFDITSPYNTKAYWIAEATVLSLPAPPLLI